MNLSYAPGGGRTCAGNAWNKGQKVIKWVGSKEWCSQGASGGKCRNGKFAAVSFNQTRPPRHQNFNHQTLSSRRLKNRPVAVRRRLNVRMGGGGSVGGVNRHRLGTGEMLSSSLYQRIRHERNVGETGSAPVRGN